MTVKIEINTDGYPMPHNATVDEVLSARISEQEAILNALTVELDKAKEKKDLMERIASEACRPRMTGL